MLKDFLNPPARFRGAPFWAWNGRLDSGELRRQVRVMHRMGLGGFFMHSRVGLDTPYLSEEWFGCVNACVDEARSLGMKAWLYDEDRWPSGAAGGLVTRNPAYRMRSIELEHITRGRTFSRKGKVLAVFAARVKNNKARNLRRVARKGRPSLGKGESLLVFREVAASRSSWYNGYTYLDTLNPEAVREFIRVTHNAYRKHCGGEFARVIPGIFTDEPNYGRAGIANENGRTAYPWTASLPSVFRKRYGYDIQEYLPEIFFDVDGKAVSAVRHHYFDCITRMFTDAFARLIGEWCGRNRLLFTGHVLGEETPVTQTGVVGSAMRFYEHMQAPGMDVLTEHSREYDTAKQVSSAARQFGRKWRLTETYGCTGWDFPFLGHKALGDWQTALGINLRCQHLSWYTMEGQAKRDYPASIFYQSPWWECYRKVEDYFGRIHAVMTRGTEVRDVLVIHPVESAWLASKDGSSVADPARDPKVIERNIVDVRDSLLDANIDFDYGDEDILDRHGKVTGGSLKVARARYRAVIVPPLLTIRSSTLRLLGRFRKAGGTVVFAGEPPRYVDALPSGEARQFAAKCRRAPRSGKKLAAEVEFSRRVSIADGKGREIAPVLYLLREDKDGFYLFIANTACRRAAPSRPPNRHPVVAKRNLSYPEVSITGFPGCRGRPVELDPDSGKVYRTCAERAGGKWSVRTSLLPLQSRLFVFPGHGRNDFPASALPPSRPGSVRRLNRSNWPVTLSENNNIVLDRPRWRTGPGKWRETEEILSIDRQLRRSLGAEPRGGRMKQPWAREPVKNPSARDLELEYTFNVETLPSGELYLALERPETFSIALNGRSVSADSECGWWVDPSLRKIPLDPAGLRNGLNRLRLACRYDPTHPGLEIVYLLGSFGARVSGTKVSLTSLPDSLRLGDWVKQGLPFYSGSVAYHTVVNRRPRKKETISVRVNDFRGAAVRVLVNGTEAGIIAWEPKEVEITDNLKKSKTHLVLEVLGHRRNSHGPLHNARKWNRWTGPGQFTNDIPGCQLVPCGLMSPPELITRKA
ncbi:MAG: glycosyl hydrolase [Kiritimatiellia bacterium]